MKEQEIVQQFIELRAQGLSFGKIAARLGVAKSTLINWSCEYQHLIQMKNLGRSEIGQKRTDFGQKWTGFGPVLTVAPHAPCTR